MRLDYESGDKSGEEGATRVLLSCKISKQKKGRPLKEVDFKLAVTSDVKKQAGQIDDEEWAIDKGVVVGVVARTGNKWIALDEAFTKKEQLLDRMYQDAAFSFVVKNQVLLALMARGVEP